MLIPTRWLQNLTAWWRNRRLAQPRGRGRRSPGSRYAAWVAPVEAVEPRLLLAATNAINVAVSESQIRLTAIGRDPSAAGDNFDVSFTGTQFKLTARNGTEFRVGSQTLTEHTINVSNPVALVIRLSSRADQVTVTGDGTARLNSLYATLGRGNGNNSLKVDNVITGNAVVKGGGRADNIAFDRSTINGDFIGRLGQSESDVLKIERSTVKGRFLLRTQQFTANTTTFDGIVRDVQTGPGSTIDLTGSTFKSAVAMYTGTKGVVNLHGSTTGANTFQKALRIVGRRQPTVINSGANTVVNTVTPTFVKATRNVVSGVTAPTVNALTADSLTPTITGTWDATRATTLTVAVNGRTYLLGQDSQLTAPTSGRWSLNLSGQPLPGGASTVTATNADTFGNSRQGTGVVTAPTGDQSQQASISRFLTANSLTGQRTSSGLNYVVTTEGTGAIPTAGMNVTVNYTGRLLNADGTLGAVFDSNVDPQFNHVTPFQFPLGQGRVIRGWDEGFALLRVGTVGKLIIPSELGYGAAGSGARIPPNSILVFDITLVSAQ